VLDTNQLAFRIFMHNI